MTIVIGMPIYLVPNILFGERPGISLSVFVDPMIPFVPWMIFFYALIYILVFLPVFTIKHRAIFTRVIFGFLTCSLIALPFFIFLPVRVPRPGIPTQESIFYWGLAFNYVLDKPVNCFPSLHVANAVFATACCMRLSPRVGFWGAVGCVLIAISTLTLRQHFFVDLVAGAAIALAVYYSMVYPVIKRVATREKPADLIFPPRIAFRIVYMYIVFVGVCAVLFFAGLRFQPVLPTN